MRSSVTTDNLVSAAELESLIDSGRCIVVDCRFEFADTSRGRAAWLAGHIPGAAYAHLDGDLSSPVTARTGRHPLPDTDRFADYRLRAVVETPDVSRLEDRSRGVGRVRW